MSAIIQGKNRTNVLSNDYGDTLNVRTNVLTDTYRQPYRLTNANTDEQIIILWLNDKKSSTQKTYAANIRTFLEFITTPLRELKIEEIQAYQAHIESLGYRPSTLKSKMAALKSLFSFGTKLNYFIFNLPQALRSRYNVRDTINERYCDKEAILLFFDAIDDDKFKCLFLLQYRLGLRNAEACTLRWSDLRGNVLTVLGKGDKTRFVTVPDDLLTELNKLYHPRDTFIFETRNGKPYDTSKSRRAIKKYAAKAGITTNISCHWLRHSHATHALRAGVHIDILSKSLGHSDVAVTSRYLHTQAGECSSAYVNLR